MDKLKRIVCIVGVIALVSLYLITLFSAIFYKKGLHNLFMASAYSTVVIPVFLYAMMLVAKVLVPKNDEK